MKEWGQGSMVVLLYLEEKNLKHLISHIENTPFI
jgi:hypothetical protein